MPELTFFSTDDDFDLLVKRAFDLGARLIPDLRYKTDHYDEITCYDSYRGCEQARLHYLVHDSWHPEPLTMKPAQSDADGSAFFFIAQRVGGPVVDVIYNPERANADVSTVGVGSIHYFASYYRLIDGATVAAPVALRAFYKALSQQIRRGASPLRQDKQPNTVWVSPGAAEALRAGTKRAPWAVTASIHME